MPRINSDTVISLYNYLYRRSTGYMDYSLIVGSRETTMINKFLKMMSDQYDGLIGADFITDYFIYQFRYWYGRRTNFGVGEVMLNWVIGQKAFGRWLAEQEDPWYDQSSAYFAETKINRNNVLKDVFGVDKVAMMSEIVGGDHERRDKALFHNTLRGLYHCMSCTTMFNPDHEECGSCDSIKECLSLMKDTYPNIYEKRIGVKEGKAVIG